MSAALPQDIIDLIVDELAEDERSLKACSLVATTFTIPTRRQLFRVVSLRPLTALQSFSDLLLLSPHIALFVRVLGVNLQRYRTDPAQRLTVLEQLVNLERLDIDHFCYLRGTPLEDSLIDVLSHSRFESLRLYSGEVAPSFLTAAMQLTQTLLLSNVRVMKSEVSESRPLAHDTPPPPALQELTLSYARAEHYALYEFLLDPTTIHHLRSLTKLVFRDGHSAEFCMNFLTAVSPTLQRLHLVLSAMQRYTFTLPPLPALRYLEVQLSRRSAARIEEAIHSLHAAAPHVEILLLYQR
ncbi:hypothetical protein C8J57DRAFT_1362763 [Mycena rebaudengoi]|nr:hypothetical protein C8J57DRAFT_1362763 [Mycena rebaudengoi]